jgi:hypothetical protein
LFGKTKDWISLKRLYHSAFRINCFIEFRLNTNLLAITGSRIALENVSTKSMTGNIIIECGKWNKSKNVFSKHRGLIVFEAFKRYDFMKPQLWWYIQHPEAKEYLPKYLNDRHIRTDTTFPSLTLSSV